MNDLEQEPVEVAPVTTADRSVPRLRSGSDLTSAIVLGTIVVLGGGAMYWALTNDDDDVVEESVVAEYRELPDNDFELPQIQARPTPTPVSTPEPVVVQPVVQPDTRPDPRRLEGQLLANRETIRQANERRERAERAERERLARRRASMLVFDRSGSAQAIVGDVTRSAADEALITRLEGRVDSLEEPASDVRTSLQRQEVDKGNEIYSDANERYLRDAATQNVQMVYAVDLPDQDYVITQGTMVAGALETAIQSDLPGMLRAVTSRDVYSRTGKTNLIPAGSTLIGRYSSGIQTGQRRIFVVWTRVERPDGVVIAIGSPGTDMLGRAGLGGEVDTHFLKRFGTSFLFSIIGAAVVVAADGDDTSRAERDVIRDGGDSFNRSAEIALQNNINIPPTIHVDQGTRINIFVGRDLNFSSALGVQ